MSINEIIICITTVLGIFGSKVYYDYRRYNGNNKPPDVTIKQALLVKKVILPDLERTIEKKIKPICERQEINTKKIESFDKKIKCFDEKITSLMSIERAANPDLYRFRMDPRLDRRRRGGT